MGHRTACNIMLRSVLVLNDIFNLRQSMVEHHNFCHDILKSFLFFSNLIGLIEISYYEEFHFLIHFG